MIQDDTPRVPYFRRGYRDELVVVSAILVDHRLCFPAFGFRIESRHGSVVVSGDTAYSENCIKLARGADVLLHEVIDLPSILATFPEGPTREGIELHLRESHTPFAEVGKVAAAAGVKTLVLHHIVPNTPGTADLAAMEAAVRRDFAGTVHIAEDNDVFFPRPDASGILESAPSHNVNVGVNA